MKKRISKSSDIGFVTVAEIDRELTIIVCKIELQLLKERLLEVIHNAKTKVKELI